MFQLLRGRYCVVWNKAANQQRSCDIYPRASDVRSFLIMVMLQKFNYTRSPKARQSARGEECTMNGPMCNYNPETTVLCHSNDSRHGKGGSIKASDEWSFYGCSGCNHWFDNEPAGDYDKSILFWMAWLKTQERFKEKGLKEVIVDLTKKAAFIDLDIIEKVRA